LLVGKSLGRYRIVERLGRGGMASVYKAFDPRFERYVALKVLSPDLAADPNFRQRFEREMKTLARLDHPNIAQIHDSGEEEDFFFMVLQYFPDGDLRARLARRPSLAEALRILHEIAKGLAHAHGVGIVHRDLKPANVLFASDGRPVLGDFGIAKLMADTIQFTQQVAGQGVGIGTPQYMSPEQVQGKPIDARTDVYAFGILAYEMLTGAPPFTGDTPIAVALQHLSAPFPRPTVAMPDLPAEVELFVLKCVERHAEDRYEGGAALAEAVEGLARGFGSFGGDTTMRVLDRRGGGAATTPLPTADDTRVEPRRDDVSTHATITTPHLPLPIAPTPDPSTVTPAGPASVSGPPSAPPQPTVPTIPAAPAKERPVTPEPRPAPAPALEARRERAPAAPERKAAPEERRTRPEPEAPPPRRRVSAVAVAAVLAVLAALAVVAVFLLRKDGTAPGAIELRAGESGETTIALTWTAPGDDGASGQARSYELRRGDAPIDNAGWDALPALSGLGAPRPAGSAESFVVSGLAPDTEYFFAVRARDDAGNLSAMSNVVSARTNAPPPPPAPPALPGQLIVAITPADASVSLDGSRTAQGPIARFDSLAAGPHTIEVRRSQYVTDTRSINIDPGSTATLEVTLAKDKQRPSPTPTPPPPAPAGDTGTLALVIDIPARLLVDGVERQSSTESTQLRLSPGSHTVRLEREGFLPRDTTFVVTAGSTVKLSMSMQRDIGTLVVKTNVSAAILVDGKLQHVGAGAGTITIAPGKHVVRAEAAGYAAQEKSVEIVARKTVEIEFDFEVQKMGSMRVFFKGGDAKGQYATIWMDGVKIDYPTPCVLDPLAPGKHKLVVEHNGVRGEATVLIEAGERLEYDVTPLLLK
jgi:serine/threonine protein kinase/chitodextrinase